MIGKQIEKRFKVGDYVERCNGAIGKIVADYGSDSYLIDWARINDRYVPITSINCTDEDLIGLSTKVEFKKAMIKEVYHHKHLLLEKMKKLDDIMESIEE